MIYTIGYAGMNVERLAEILTTLKVTRLYDCRSIANSRHRGFGGRQLAARFPGLYVWMGVHLGGRGSGPTQEGIELLAHPHGRTQITMLMCMEEAPGDCHRHRTVAVPLLQHGIDCTHVY